MDVQVGDESGHFTEEFKERVREKINNPPIPTFIEELENDPLIGYKVDKAEKLYNYLNEEILGGVNQKRKRPESGLRKECGVPEIEDWNKEIEKR